MDAVDAVVERMICSGNAKAEGKELGGMTSLVKLFDEVAFD